MTQRKHYTGGEKIMVCRNIEDVESAFAAGTIAHLLSGEVKVDILGRKRATLWVSGDAKATVSIFENAKATIEAHGNAKAIVAARGKAEATARAYDNAKATVWVFDGAKVIVDPHDNAKVAVAWLSSATPSSETATHITYKTATGKDADANIREVAAFIKRERASFNMGIWHSDDRNENGEFPCGTTHCMAGAAVFLKGDEGRKMEEMFGSEVAGAIILGKEAAKHFYTSDKNALIFLSSKLGEPIE